MAYLQICWKLNLALFAAGLIFDLVIYSLDCGRSCNCKQLKPFVSDVKSSDTMVNLKRKTKVTTKKKERELKILKRPHFDQPVCKTFLSTRKENKKELLQHKNEELKQSPTALINKTKEKKTIAANVASGSIGNTAIYRRYPGLMFLPNYKLQSFITPDNTRETISLALTDYSSISLNLRQRRDSTV